MFDLSESNRIKTKFFAQTQAGMKTLKRRDSKTDLVGASCLKGYYEHDPNLLMKET